MATAEQEALLAVQEHDTAADRLRHRRAHLPARAELDQVRARAVTLGATQADVQRRRDEAAGLLARGERDLAATEGRLAEVDRRMFSGSVSAARELQQLATESEHLKDRRSRLEDEVLEAMSQLEPLDAELAAVGAELDALRVQEAAARTAVAEGSADVEAQLAEVEAARAEAVAAVSPSLLAEYERLRTRLGGVGAARVVGSSCSGCHLALPSTELEAVRHAAPGQLVTCEQCGRILVPA